MTTEKNKKLVSSTAAIGRIMVYDEDKLIIDETAPIEERHTIKDNLWTIPAIIAFILLVLVCYLIIMAIINV